MPQTNRFDACVNWVDAKNRNIALAAALLSLLFVPFASVYTSPYNPYYGSDAAVFMVIGKGMTQGLVPYLDLYDHKGPLLFFFNALGYWLYDGKVGVLCVQLVFFAICTFLVYKMARLFLPAGASMLAVAALCFYYITMVEGGNLSEEWSLVFSLLPMYLALRFAAGQGGDGLQVASGKDGGAVSAATLPNAQNAASSLNAVIPAGIAAHPLRLSFVYGLCLGVQVYIRLNNASVICGIILAFVVLLCMQKAYAALFANAGMVLAGVVAVTLPIVAYFAAHGALAAFWQAAFVDNFVYAFAGAETKTAQEVAMVLLRLLLYPVLVVACWRLVKAGAINRAVAVLAVCMGSVSAPLLFLGYGYLHYFLVFAPVMVLALCLVGRAYLARVLCARRPLLVLVAVLCIAFAPFAYRFARQVGVNIAMDAFDYCEAEVESVAQVMQHVPAEDADSIWAYDVNARFYLYADVLPCYTYFVSQSFHAQAAPEIAAEIDTMLLGGDTPQWIVTGAPAEQLANETLQMVLAEEYTLVDTATYGLGLYLYQKN